MRKIIELDDVTEDDILSTNDSFDNLSEHESIYFVSDNEDILSDSD